MSNLWDHYITDPFSATTTVGADDETQYQARVRLGQLATELVASIPYCPWTPNPGPQTAFLLDFGRESLYGGAVAGGKLQRLTTPIPVPSGWTAMGDLVAGDSVLGEDGQVHTVLIAHEPSIPERAYRLVFDDGSELVAGGEHLWLTYDNAELAALTRNDPEWRARRRAKRPTKGPGGNRSELFSQVAAARNTQRALDHESAPVTGSIRTTDEIAATLHTSRGNTNHAIPVTAPVALPHADLPLDPYLLGVWLGDGSKSGGQITGMDAEIFQSFLDAGFEMGTVQARTTNQAVQVCILGLASILRRLGVLNNKHVPLAYLRASIPQRLALLQGLMDTDGTVNGLGQVEFTNTNRRLADAVRELACSLGHKVRMRESRATLYGKDCGPKWVLKWSSPDPLFRLPRKSVKQRMTFRRTTRFRYIVACEPIEPEPMRCITVDNPSGLYLAGESFIPTHNSIALLMSGSQFLNIPGYAALLLRKSFSDLQKPRALMDIAEEWWGGMEGVKPDRQNHSYIFTCLDSTGTDIGRSTLTFGALDNINDRYKYQGGGYHYVGFDELTQFPERDYRYLFSRMRRSTDSFLARIPMRFRAATNPGGNFHDWVYRRFIVPWEKWKFEGGRRPTRNFHPAKLDDNPKIDAEDYRQSLAELDPILRAQLEEGDWHIRPQGRMFKSSWFKVIEREKVPFNCVWCRFWDMAGTEEDAAKEPDYTVGALVGMDSRGNRYIADIRRWRVDPDVNDLMILTTKLDDTQHVVHGMEQEPGSSGKIAVYHYRQTIFYDDYTFRGIPSTGSKIVRARPVANKAAAGNVYIVQDNWNDAMMEEFDIFPDGIHDDQVDAVSGAFAMLNSIHTGELQLGVMVEEFAGQNPWRPDASPDHDPRDVASQAALLGQRVEEVRMSERQLSNHFSSAFEV